MIGSKEIFDNALNGYSISKEEAILLMDSTITNLDELILTANKVKKMNFDNKVEMCAIYPAKVGRCSGDCAYCSQSSSHNCDVKFVSIKDLDESAILQNAKTLYSSGVKRYSLVTSSERLTDKEFDDILKIFHLMKSKTKIELCASLGSLTRERAHKLIDVGVTRYHHNIETSRNYFSQICTTHSYDEKIETIIIAKNAGLGVCSGGIISMGETPIDRIDMAFELKNLAVDCVPINILNPIRGTKLENQKLLTVEDLLRTIAIFRLILPQIPLRFAGGRENAFGNKEYMGFVAGINSMIVGNYLTTPGKTVEEELKNIAKAELELTRG